MVLFLDLGEGHDHNALVSQHSFEAQFEFAGWFSSVLHPNTTTLCLKFLEGLLWKCRDLSAKPGAAPAVRPRPLTTLKFHVFSF